MASVDQVRGAGDELYADVRRIAAALLYESKHVVAEDGRAMGRGPGTYEFKLPQLRKFGDEVVRRLNEERETGFKRTTDLDPEMTFGALCISLWIDCFKQMAGAADLRKTIGVVS